MKREVPGKWSRTARSPSRNAVFMASTSLLESPNVFCLSTELSISYAGVRSQCHVPKIELLSLLLFHTLSPSQQGTVILAFPSLAQHPTSTDTL
jgi:hypothetical protein